MGEQMPKINVYNLEKKVVGSVDLPDSVFATKVRPSLVHQVVVAQLSGRRRGTAHTKTKGEVRGGGKKPFKQKGTGNARQGSTRSPLNKGGGVIFGPRTRSFWQAVPKKMAQGAMCSVLSDRLQAKRLLVVESLTLEKPKTKFMQELLEKKFGMDKALVIDEPNKSLEMASRNLPSHKFLRTEGANVYDIVKYEWLILSKQTALALGEKLSKLSKQPEKQPEKQETSHG